MIILRIVLLASINLFFNRSNKKPHKSGGVSFFNNKMIKIFTCEVYEVNHAK